MTVKANTDGYGWTVTAQQPALHESATGQPHSPEDPTFSGIASADQASPRPLPTGAGISQALPVAHTWKQAIAFSVDWSGRYTGLLEPSAHTPGLSADELALWDKYAHQLWLLLVEAWLPSTEAPSVNPGRLQVR